MLQTSKLFRFEDLAVWQRAADLAFDLGNLADQLEQRRRYRFAEQLRAAALSISNNIAEGSGSSSKNEFRNFLNIARRSAFECANMLMAFQRQELTAKKDIEAMLLEISEICRMITALSKTLR